VDFISVALGLPALPVIPIGSASECASILSNAYSIRKKKSRTRTLDILIEWDQGPIAGALHSVYLLGCGRLAADKSLAANTESGQIILVRLRGEYCGCGFSISLG
jgi:hypothetical protein